MAEELEPVGRVEGLGASVEPVGLAEPAEEAPAAADGTNVANGTTPPAPATAPPAGGDAKSEIIRKMMEKRAKEMGK